jgi:hypothetical protein
VQKLANAKAVVLGVRTPAPRLVDLEDPGVKGLIRMRVEINVFILVHIVRDPMIGIITSTDI